MYANLRDGRCDIAAGTSTDGRIAAWNFFTLEDTLNAFPDNTVVSISRQETLKQHPELAATLNDLSKALNTTTMTKLNALLDLGADNKLASGDEEAADAVAKSFLCDQKLLKTCGAAAPASTAAVTNTKTLSVPQVVTATQPVTTAQPVTTPAAVEADATPAPTATTAPAATAAATSTTTAGSRVTISTPATYGVNARTTASTDAPIVQLLAHSTVLEAIGRTADNSWLQIVLADGTKAWVFTAAVLANEGSILNLPVITPPALTQ